MQILKRGKIYRKNKNWSTIETCSHCKAKLKLQENNFYAKEESYKGGYDFVVYYHCLDCGRKNCRNGLPKRITARLIAQAKQEES